MKKVLKKSYYVFKTFYLQYVSTYECVCSYILNFSLNRGYAKTNPLGKYRYY